MLGLIYARRILKRKKSLAIMTPYYLPRWFLVTYVFPVLLSVILRRLMIASKFLDDFYCRNIYFASVGGISTAALNEMELRVCFLLDFDLCVTKDQFETSMFALSMGTTQTLAMRLITQSPALGRRRPLSIFPSVFPSKRPCPSRCGRPQVGFMSCYTVP